MLKIEAPCSCETDRSVGTGGIFCNRSGLSLRYHFFFCIGCTSASPDADLEVLPWSLSSATTTLCSGWGADMLNFGYLNPVQLDSVPEIGI